MMNDSIREELGIKAATAKNLINPEIKGVSLMSSNLIQAKISSPAKSVSARLDTADLI
jgi:hypothetical protein